MERWRGLPNRDRHRLCSFPSVKSSVRLLVTPGYHVAFDCFDLPASIDVVMGAPRMIGAGIGDPIGTAGQLIRK